MRATHSPDARREFDADRTRWLSAAVAIAVAVAFGLVAGLGGVLAGVATAFSWHRWGTPYAIGIGSVLLVVASPAGLEPGAVPLIAGAFAGLLAISARLRGTRWRTLVAGGSVALSIGGLAWAALAWGVLWPAALVVLVGFASASYALRRLQLVRLGLVTDDATAARTEDV